MLLTDASRRCGRHCATKAPVLLRNIPSRGSWGREGSAWNGGRCGVGKTTRAVGRQTNGAGCSTWAECSSVYDPLGRGSVVGTIGRSNRGARAIGFRWRGERASDAPRRQVSQRHGCADTPGNHARTRAGRWIHVSDEFSECSAQHADTTRSAHCSVRISMCQLTEFELLVAQAWPYRIDDHSTQSFPLVRRERGFRTSRTSRRGRAGIRASERFVCVRNPRLALL